MLETLIGIASSHVNGQLQGLCTRLAAALLDPGGLADDSAAVPRRCKAAKLLQNNSYVFMQLIAVTLERALRVEIAHLAPVAKAAAAPAQPMSLVPYEEMESRAALSALCAPFEAKHADPLAALNVRLAFLLDREILRIGQNPFRPEVFLMALQQAWHAFVPEAGSEQWLLPLLKPEQFLELGPMLRALDLALMRSGILPGSLDSYKGRSADSQGGAPRLASQLRQLFRAGAGPAAPMPTPPAERRAPAAARQPLLEFLSRLQQAESGAQRLIFLSGIKESVPGGLSGADEKTIDLLSAIFEAIFRDPDIAPEMRALIGFLQIPVLKAALLERDFFFQPAHPARRLIDLLSQLGWEHARQPRTALFDAMQRSVERIGRDCDGRPDVFGAALRELEAALTAEEQAGAGAMAQPIASALRQEKMAQAARAASAAVALRLQGGEVVAVVEAFLENKWVAVLTLAHGLEQEQPGALDSATRTMDELIWSVKPKLSADERRELIGKLPALLAMLHKWLDIIAWQDAERAQFFAELAECHASIVRAPLALSPERQAEIALEAAHQAALRRHERKRRAQACEAAPDQACATVAALQRGMWMAFTQADGARREVRLAWISPLRTLFIFATHAQQEAFSLSGEALAARLRAGQAALLQTGDAVGRALSLALAGTRAPAAGIDSQQEISA